MEWSFDQVFDLFFKTHAVFHEKFDANIANMMLFFKHFFYEMRDDKKTEPTTRMRDVFEKVTRQIQIQ